MSFFSLYLLDCIEVYCQSIRSTIELYITDLLGVPAARLRGVRVAGPATHLPIVCLCVTLLKMDAELAIKENLTRVRERIAAAAQRAGRAPGEVKLVAVTKTHPPQVVAAAYRAGLRDFGENRVEEANDKIPLVRELTPPQEELRWHMIGHLQRRKARLAVALFDMIHSVDSLRLAERINRLAEGGKKVVPILLEVNVSGEATKYGYDLSGVAGSRAEATFMADVERILELPHVRPCGLMTMAPIVPEPELARPVFVALRALQDNLARRFPEADWRELSMGMTDDFEVAIEEGATMVRIGRAIFEERK
jgi:pyridoxal phosphate enzyme (YggS family)